MSKAAAVIIAVLAITTCVLGAVVYVLLPTPPTPPTDTCWRKTYVDPYNVPGNETWQYFTMTITTERVATVTVNFSTTVSASLWTELTLRWEGISYWFIHNMFGGTISNFTEFTSFPAGTHTLSLSVEEGEVSQLINTFLEVCITYS